LAILLGWRLGPYGLDHQGILYLEGRPLQLKPLQRQALLVLVQAGGMVSREQLTTALWPDAPPQDPGALAQVIHGLRRELNRGPLGGQVIETVYGRGYAYTGPLTPLSGPSPGPTAATPDGATPPIGQTTNPPTGAVSPTMLHREAWARWRSGDPLQLAEVVRLLKDCLALDPRHAEAVVDLCHSLLLQAGWGMACTRRTGLELQVLLQQARVLAVDPHAIASIHAETLTVLFWQPERSDHLYASWLPQRLSLDRPLLGWVRHLIYSGQSRAATVLLDERLRSDLPQGWGLKAFAHMQLAEWPEAEDALRRQMALRGAQIRPPLELALVHAVQGKHREAAALVEQVGILDQDTLSSLHALAGFSLAGGPQRPLAAALLDRWVNHRADRQRETAVGAPSLWGLLALALALGERALATEWLTTAVQERCCLALFLWHGALLWPYQQEPAVQCFRQSMAKACGGRGLRGAGSRNSSTKI
jgi:DNA-binding winged helix-turn-helix (wHTH) protein